MNRRSLLKIAPAVLVASAVPVAAATLKVSRREEIQRHAEALLLLIREEFPDAEKLGITVHRDFLGGSTHLTARATKVHVIPNARIKGGGLRVEAHSGELNLAEGIVKHWNAHGGETVTEIGARALVA